MCFCFPHWKEVAVCIKELPGSTLSLWWWLSLRILKKIIGQLFGIPIHQELFAEIKTRPCLVSANILVTLVLSRPTWHSSQETAPGSRLCLGGTGPGSVHRKSHPPTFALLKRTQFMDNKVSGSKSFFAVSSLFQFQCSFPCSGGEGWEGWDCRVSIQGNKEESGIGRKCGRAPGWAFLMSSSLSGISNSGSDRWDKALPRVS